MLLVSAVRDQFPPDVRRRGETYYSGRKVTIDDSDDSWLTASVRGGSTYDVDLEYERGKLRVSCTCPHFDSGYACKHIWAAIIASDAERIIKVPTDAGSIVLKLDSELADMPDEFEEDEVEPDDGPPDIVDIVRNISQSGWKSGGRNPIADILSRVAKPPKPRKSSWKEVFAPLKDVNAYRGDIEVWPAGQEIVYQIDVESTLISGDGIRVNVACRRPKKNGEWCKPKPFRVEDRMFKGLPDDDRKIMALLSGARQSSGWSAPYYTGSSVFGVPDSLSEMLLPMLLGTGRCQLYRASSEETFLPKFDDGAPWDFRLNVEKNEESKQYVVRGILVRGESKEDLSAPVMLVAGGWVFWADRVARLDDGGAFGWISILRREREIRVPLSEGNDFVELFYGSAPVHLASLPDGLQYEEISVAPQPRLTVKRPKYARDDAMLVARVRFKYGSELVDPGQDANAICIRDRRVAIRRDRDAEERAKAKLAEVGVRPIRYPIDPGVEWEFPGRHLPRIVSALVAENWAVEAEGKLYRKAGDFKLDVSTGIDWFEVRGSVSFDGVAADLPALLKALKHKENTILLGDGTFGILPEEWLKKYGTLAALGEIEKDHLKFQRNQAGVLDVLIAAQPDATCDETFRKVRDELRSFESVQPADPPVGFTGTLRAYQRDGLGWLHFLRKFGFGGCLADDMGLGKTVQVLALLESRRELRAREKAGSDGGTVGPSLAVAPRSLIFNWKREAARFAPELRVLDHTGTGRYRSLSDFGGCDLVLTTYGTLVRDIAHLKQFMFDLVILDEAQAIKNADTQAAKAARLLHAGHRLALSGTPVQNHLGELWSLFEFLNPGMLGAASVFRLTDAGSRNPDADTRELLGKAIRPFVLRRTKAQVAKDLPERTEETLYCEMEGEQRKMYDELRDHYRRALLKQVDAVGMNRAKIMILEALLRLRQAACHPGLVDGKLVHKSSAKLEALLPQLAEVMDEGHKALVFSQFTSMLAIVRSRLDSEKVVYEYLDGKTMDRESRVRRFQEDPECKLFLISLKAGGLGLNLTAAEYVFLLDPWWNPAVEMQAIDRAHRIGQTRQVFAYRLIAKESVEEKVIELQKTKKDLADSIINADNSLIRTLCREDLELLLA